MGRPVNKEELREAANVNFNRLLEMIENRTEEEKNHAPNAYSVYYWMYFHGVLSFDSVFRARTVNTII